MNWAVFTPIALSVATAVIVGFRRILADFAVLIQLQTQLKEKVELARVGIEVLGIVDQDFKTRLVQLEQRQADLERYLQTMTQGWEKPFLLRQGNRQSER